MTGNFETLMQQASLAFRKRKLEEARDFFRRAAVSGSPKRLDAVLAWARCETAMGNFGTSDKVLEGLGGVDALALPVLKLQASNHEGLKRFDLFAVTLLNIGRLEPKDPKLLFRYGNRLAALSKHDEAIELYDRVLQILNFAEAHFNKANSLVALGRISDATESFAAALKIRPEWTDCLTNLANAQLELGQLDQSKANLKLKTQPSHRL